MNQNVTQSGQPFARFSIDPVKALIVLEQEELLSEESDLCSPLRRMVNDDGVELQLPLVWDSRELERYDPGAFATQPDAKTSSLLGELGSAKSTAETSVSLGKPRLVFVARKGRRFDGHSLVEKVLAAGHIFIAEKNHIQSYLNAAHRPQEWSETIFSHPFLLLVTSTEMALARLLERASNLHADLFTTLAVTGTNGKTSVTQICGDLWESLSRKDVLKMGTLGIQMQGTTREGTHVTMPDYPGFLEAVSDAKRLGVAQIVLEATSHGLQEGRFGSWQADAALFTNLTQDHLDYHGTMAQYRDAKALLFERHLKPDGTAIVNTCAQDWETFALKASHAQRTVIGMGSPAQKQMFFEKMAHKFGTLRFLQVSDRKIFLRSGIQGHWQLASENGVLAESNYTSPLIGDFQHDNLALAAGALLATGYPLAEISEAAKNIRGIPGRLELVQLEQSNTNLPVVLVDYAHSPDALEKALRTVRTLRTKTGRILCVFGCGGDRDRTKRPLMGDIAASLADRVIVTSDNPRTENPESIVDEIFTGIKEKSHVSRETDRRKAIFQALNEASADDIVLIAGKGHEDYQILGSTKHPFLDTLVAREALEQKIRN
jgi:UDP-N-acetylmuramoyl-L-alanyl-D-glutamate--2,6-diaminopimelate ligase